MAKKRKALISDTPQPPEPEPIEQEPEPLPEPQPVEIKQEEVVEEEIEEEIEEEVEEEVEEVEDEEGEKEENQVKIEQTNGGGAIAGEPQNIGSGSVADSDLEDDDEPFEKLLEPFSKDQMVVLLKEAVLKHPDLMASVRKLADADPSHRKIFVHGLGWDTMAETLTGVFGKYGEIEDCKVVTDKVSGKSKGYGFILFKHRSGARKALLEPQKKIGTRMTSCQLASTGPVPVPPPVASPPVSEYTQRKIFVSNVALGVDPQKLLEFFSKYGEIEDGPLGLDKQTGKPKGFCLFVYKSVESARKALEEPHKNFEGHTLHCQKAIDGPKQSKQYPQQQQQQQHQHHQQHYGGGGQQHHHQQYYGHPAKKGKYSGSSHSSVGGGSGGHLMAPTGAPSMGYNPAAAAAPATTLTPALGQALTALLAGHGVGIGNFLGGFSGPVNQGVPPTINNAGYGGQSAGGYGAQPGLQGGYQNPQLQGVWPQQGGAPYMGHGH